VTAVDDFLAAGPEIQRDRFGRPLVVPPGGGKPTPYTRCTTYVDCLEDKFNLAKWQQRMVAIGITERTDLRLAVAAHRDDKNRLNDLCEQALEAAKATAGATTGTALHAFTEQHDRGQLDLRRVPPDFRADLDAYITATRGFGIVDIETFGVLDDLKIAGTWDRILTVDGVPYIADLKTGSIEFGMGKIAMQLAVYSRCQRYDMATHQRSPLTVDQDRALVIHLPAGTGECSLHWVDINAGWDAVDLATQVRAWRARRGLARPYTPPAAGPDMAKFNEQVTEAPTLAALRALWHEYAGVWTHEMTAICAQRRDELVATDSTPKTSVA
jgi:hypothetical protein